MGKNIQIDIKKLKDIRFSAEKCYAKQIRDEGKK